MEPDEPRYTEPDEPRYTEPDEPRYTEQRDPGFPRAIKNRTMVVRRRLTTSDTQWWAALCPSPYLDRGPRPRERRGGMLSTPDRLDGGCPSQTAGDHEPAPWATQRSSSVAPPSNARRPAGVKVAWLHRQGRPGANPPTPADATLHEHKRRAIELRDRGLDPLTMGRGRSASAPGASGLQRRLVKPLPRPGAD